MTDLKNDIFSTAIKSFVGATVVFAIGVGGSILTGAWSTISAIAALPEQVEKISDDIRKLSLPKRFFEVSNITAPVAGYCVEGKDCLVRYRIRRAPEAAQCKLQPQEIRYFYKNPRNNEQFDVSLRRGNPRDVSEEWTNLSLTFSTPFGVAPESEFCATAKYLDCPGQIPADGFLTQPAECVSFTIKTKE